VPHKGNKKKDKYSQFYEDQEETMDMENDSYEASMVGPSTTTATSTKKNKKLSSKMLGTGTLSKTAKAMEDRLKRLEAMLEGKEF
jgi:HPt (histidine-containing phosphotransfer) domain-containing protein